MSKLLLVVQFMIAFVLVGCDGRVNTKQETATYRLQHDYDTACTQGKCPCASPLGPIVDGGTAVAYDTSKVACGQTCSTRAMTLTCSNGKFDRDITNLSFSCGVESCQACTAGNNQVPHGFTVVMFDSQNVSCGASCDDAKRALVCNNGALQGTVNAPSPDGKDPTYKFATCAPSNCNCTLPGNGSLTLGGSLKFYKTNTGTCDATCDAVANVATRACTNTGTASVPNLALSGDATFQYLTCNGPSQAACDCILPDTAKTILRHGQSQALFSANTQVNCSTCTSQQVMAYCGMGVLYDKPITDVTKKVLTPAMLTSHMSLTCDPLLTKDCTINALCIANNGAQKLYAKSTLVCGDDLSALTSTFSCTNKTLSKDAAAYNAGTDTYASSWQTSQPTNTCVGCSTPWKATVANNIKVVAYKSAGSSSNSCGNGCKSTEFTCKVTAGVGKLISGDSAVDADIVANPANYTKECTNTCSAEGGGAPPRACLLPWQNSFVTPDTTIPMYNQKTAVCGDSCANHFRVGRCQLLSGTFDAGLSYIYQSCTELACGGLKITKVMPTYVPPAGGSITLTGTGFTGSSTVKIGTYVCGSIAIANGGTTLTCTAPAGAGLFQDIVVKDAGQTAMLPRSFSYYTGTCAAGPGVKTFAYTGGMQSFTVPAGCTKAIAKVWGAGGAGHFSYSVGNTQFGGSGGFSSGAISVTPSQVLTVGVGGGGYFFNTLPAAGGGYSGLFSSTTINAGTALIVAGGGGGAGDPNGCNVGSTGGEGGGAVGGTHGGCSGKGGTQSAGGAGGNGAAAGAAFLGATAGGTSVTGGYLGGGSAGSSSTGGGGGGGGFFGGGAGAEASALGGAGGGGSGYLSPSVTSGVTSNGSAQYPPNMNDPNYITGVGLGGGLTAGGNGLIVIAW